MILVAGGSGTLGTQLVPRLLTRGLCVRVLTRSARRVPIHEDERLEVVEGDVRVQGTLVAAVQGVATVVSAVHGLVGPCGVSPSSVDRDGNANLFAAAASAGAAVVLISVVGASADSPMELFRMKHAAEQRLRAGGIPATIVRATAFLRRGSGCSGRRRFARGVRWYSAEAITRSTLSRPLTSPPLSSGPLRTRPREGRRWRSADRRTSR